MTAAVEETRARELRSAREGPTGEQTGLSPWIAARASRGTIPDTVQKETILFVGIAEDDGLSLEKILLDSNWQPHCTGNCREAFKFLSHHDVSVVLSQPELPDGTWRELLNGMAELSAPPSLIISSRLADHLLWAEVLNLGGYDVLMTPFGGEEVLRVLGGAQRNWERKNVGGHARAAGAGQPGTPS